MKIRHGSMSLVTEKFVGLFPLYKQTEVSEFCWFDFHFLFLPFSSPHPAFHLPESPVYLIYMWKNLEHHVVRFQGNTESHSILISSLTVAIESIMFSMPSSWPPRRSQITFHLPCQSHSDHVHFSLLTHCHVTS